MIKGIIFDLDGTLIDSMKVWYDVDRNFLKENGIDNYSKDISEKVKKMTIFDSSEYLIKRFNLNLTKEYVINRIEELVRKEYEENIPLKPHVIDTLDFLDSKNIPYGIATATYKSLADAVLKRNGIGERFAFILTDKEYPKGKNFPDIFFGSSEILGSAPSETLVVEDSLHSIKTASGAGFLTVGIYDECADLLQQDIKNTADYYFKSIDGIKTLF